MSQKLFHRAYGETEQGPALVILHGLFGSSKNWHSICQKLSKSRKVFALDLRNHGESFHDPSHTMPALANDVVQWLKIEGLNKVDLLGHSMGGLTAMIVAITQPQVINKLVVVDIAPKTYELDYTNEFKALSIDLKKMSSRQEIDAAMQAFVEDVSLRQFLQTNVDRDSNGYRWRLNVSALKNARQGASLSYDFTNKEFAGPCLFLRGETSNFVQDADKEKIKSIFIRAEIETIAGAGHWLHHSHQAPFLEAINSFL